MDRLGYILLLFFVFMGLQCCNHPKAVPDSRVNDYALYDASGDFHRLSRYNNSKAIVLWVQGNGCPIVRNALTDFNGIVSDYSNKGITFFMLNCNPQDDRENTSKEAAEFNFAVPVLMDSAQLIADELDIKITSEAIVLHPTTRKVLYRGPLNNRLDYEAQKTRPSETYLRDALDAILKGKQIRNRTEMTRGCSVTRYSKTSELAPLTYTEDIAPILINNCVKCHNPYGIAPWSMRDHKTISGWSSMMKQVLLSKRMPPWKADPEIGDFSNSFYMEDSNARKIVRWIDQGLKYGSGPDPLAQLKHELPEWQYGEPDTIISLKAESLPATGLLAYRYQKIPLNFSEDRWLRGVDIKPGVNKALHHVVVTNTERNKKSPITNRKQRPWTDNYIALGGNNARATFFEEGSAVLLPAQMTLTTQLHYTTTGKQEVDETKIGLYFAKEPPKNELFALSPSNVDLKIPAYANNVVHSISDTISRAIKIHYVVPHMHYRGKSIKFSVIFPNGEKHILVSIPDFNFNWQWFYQLKTPFEAPAGSIILVEGVFDNSPQNPLNPDPSQDLTFGIQSSDEMLIGFFNYTLAD